MTEIHESVSQVISNELSRAKAKNARFSMRAFAQWLGLSSTHLNQILSGKRNLSLESGEKIAKKLKFNAIYTSYFLTLIEMENASPSGKALLRAKAESLQAKLQAKRSKPEGVLKKVSWEHLLILILIDFNTKADKKTVKQFAAFLKIEESKLDLILQVLQEADLIQKVGGRFSRTHRQLVLESDSANSELKRMHALYLTRLASLIQDRTPADRYSVTEFLSIPKRRIPEVKERAEAFLDEISTWSRGAERDTLLEVALHLNFTSQLELLDE